MLSTAEKVPLSRKVIFVTWSKPTPRQVQMERFLSPLLKRLGGCQGLAAAATGWLSDEGQRRGTATAVSGPRPLPAPAVTQAPGQRRLPGAAAPPQRALRAQAPLLPMPTFLQGVALPRESWGKATLGKINHSQETVISVKREG